MCVRSSTKFYFRFNLDMDRSPGFGSAHTDSGPIQTWFPFGSAPSVLNLASTGNSPDRSTKSTRLHLNVLPQFVNTGFQVLFHSPPGVLFTFPSQYYALSVTKEYLALGGWSPRIPTRFLVSRGTLDSARSLLISCTGLSPSLAGLPRPFHYHTSHLLRSLTPERTRSGLGSFHFARRYFGNRVFFLFLALLRCFSSGGSRRNAMDSRYDD